MKILLISSPFYPSQGGVEQVVEDIASNLSLDNEVKVVTSSGLNDNKIFSLKGLILERKEELYSGFTVKRIFLNLPSSFYGLVAFPIRFITSVLALYKYIKSFNPDVINYHFPDDSITYVFLVLLFIKKPLVINVHGNDLQVYGKKALYRYMQSYLFNYSQSIIVNSVYMKEIFEDKYIKYKNKVHIIPNGIIVDKFVKAASKRFFRGDYIVFVGRMVNKKGVDVLLYAFKKLDIPNLKLLVIGYGELLEKYTKLKDDLGLKDKVVIASNTSEVEKLSYIKDAIFAVMPSRIEPFGIVALEMMACGVPLISSDVGGLKKIVENERNGLVFNSENVDMLKDCMARLYRDSALRSKFKTKGFETAKEYSWVNIVLKYVELYKNAINIFCKTK